MVYKDQASCTAGIQVAGATAYNVNCTPATNLAGKDMHWRIIRINGDGSVRMIYDGTKAWLNEETSNDKIAFSSNWYNERTFAEYVGYMRSDNAKFYQEDLTHIYNGDVTALSDEIRLSQKYYNDPYNAVYNQTPSNMKIMLENWFEQNLLDYDNYLGDEIF